MVNILRQSRSTATTRSNSTRTRNRIYVFILSILFILLVSTSVTTSGSLLQKIRYDHYDAVEQKSSSSRTKAQTQVQVQGQEQEVNAESESAKAEPALKTEEPPTIEQEVQEAKKKEDLDASAEKNTNSKHTNNTAQAQAHAHKKHLFIDVGANCGNSYWKIKNDPNNQVLDSKNWETYLWECNPQMNKFFLRELADSDPSIHLIEKAASTKVSVIFTVTGGKKAYPTIIDTLYARILLLLLFCSLVVAAESTSCTHIYITSSCPYDIYLSNLLSANNNIEWNPDILSYSRPRRNLRQIPILRKGRLRPKLSIFSKWSIHSLRKCKTCRKKCHCRICQFCRMV